MIPTLTPQQTYSEPTPPFTPDRFTFTPQPKADEQVAIVSEETSVAATSTGAVNIGSAPLTLQLEPTAAREAQLTIAYTWAETADGAFRLQDATANTVIATGSAKTGGETGTETITVDLAKLTPGNTLRLQANITTAGETGETITVTSATLTVKRYKRH